MKYYLSFKGLHHLLQGVHWDVVQLDEPVGDWFLKLILKRDDNHLLDGMISISTLKMKLIIYMYKGKMYIDHEKTWDLISKWIAFCIIYPKTNTLPGSRWCHSSRAQRRRGRGLKWLNIQPRIRPPTPARSFCICAGTDHTWGRGKWHQIKSVCAHLWLLVSIPVPITSPPTVKSSNSGTMGIVQPSLGDKNALLVTFTKLFAPAWH